MKCMKFDWLHVTLRNLELVNIHLYITQRNMELVKMHSYITLRNMELVNMNPHVALRNMEFVNMHSGYCLGRQWPAHNCTPILLKNYLEIDRIHCMKWFTNKWPWEILTHRSQKTHFCCLYFLNMVRRLRRCMINEWNWKSGNTQSFTMHGLWNSEQSLQSG